MEEVLNELKKAYDLREQLKQMDINVPDGLEDRIDLYEEKYVTNIIIPKLEAYAKELLNEIKCELLIVIKKDENGKISVSDECTEIIDPLDDSNTNDSTNATTTPKEPLLLNVLNRKEAEGRYLRVTFPDGEVFEGRNCKETFINSLKKIGLSRIPDVGLTFAGYNLVDTRQRTDDGKAWQQKVGDYWVYIYSGNSRKVHSLIQIARFLNIKLKIEAY